MGLWGSTSSRVMSGFTGNWSPAVGESESAQEGGRQDRPQKCAKVSGGSSFCEDILSETREREERPFCVDIAFFLMLNGFVLQESIQTDKHSSSPTLLALTVCPTRIRCLCACIFVCVCACSCVMGTRIPACMWRLEDNLGCHFCLMLIFLSRGLSLTGTHHVGNAGWPGSSRDPPAFTSPELGLPPHLLFVCLSGF